MPKICWWPDLAVAGKERSPRLPEVPTTAELGYSKAGDGKLVCGLRAADTPAPIIARLSEAIKDAMALSE